MSTTDCLIYKGVVSDFLNKEIASAILHNDYCNLRDRLSKYFCSDCIKVYMLCSQFRKIIKDEVKNRWVICRFCRYFSYNFDFYLQYECKCFEKSSEEMEKSNVGKEVMNVIEDLRADNQMIRSVNLHEFSKDSDIATSVINQENYRRTIQVPTNIDFQDLEGKTKIDILHTIIEENLPKLLNQTTTNVVIHCSSTFENLCDFGIMNKDVENLYASEIQLLKIGLGRVFKVNPEAIIIASVKSGSTIVNHTITEQIDPNQVKNGLRDSPNFVYAKLHEILTCDEFQLQEFDTRGDKDFTSAAESFEIGPIGRTQTYTQPKGYHRYGLKVLGKYPDDKWLHPFGTDGNWYRAFHGTARAHIYITHKGGKSEEVLNRDAMASIYKDGFNMANVSVFGPGVYCSPSIEFLEECDYIGEFGKFKFALQVCVDPDNCNIVDDDIYVAKTPAAIRPYGIIIK